MLLSGMINVMCDFLAFLFIIIFMYSIHPFTSPHPLDRAEHKKMMIISFTFSSGFEFVFV